MATIPPILILVSPWQDPPNTFRATSIRDMYSIVAFPNMFDITYEVGVPPTAIVPRIFTFRNNTQSNELELNLTLPPWWVCDTDMPTTILRNTTIIFSLNFVEGPAISNSKTNVKTYPDEIIFNIAPVQVNGPVYVFNNLPPLIANTTGITLPPILVVG